MSSIYETYQPPVLSGGFLKIADKQTVTMRIASEPVIFSNDYKGNISTRYGWVIYNHDEKCAQIMIMSGRFFTDLSTWAKDPEYGDPTKYNIKVTRNGIETATTYTIIGSPKRDPLTSEQQEAVDKVDIIKAISAGQGVSSVFWLAEAERGTANTGLTNNSGYGQAKAKADEIRNKGNDVALEDINDDEPIDLSEIPF